MRLQSSADEFGTSVDPGVISSAEERLGRVFPASFRQFLSDFGWASVAHWEIFGLGDKVPQHLDLVSLTLSEREEIEPRLPEALIPVANDGGGNLYCLDTGNMSDEECPVVFWSHEEGRVVSREADSFVDWMIEMLDDVEGS